MISLLPCPFCGCKDVVPTLDDESRRSDDKWTVQCGKCFAERRGGSPNPDCAAANWNERDFPFRLTDDEKLVLKTTADLWNAYAALPVQHAQDLTEFATHIHALQHIIALRVARRIDPDVWSVDAPPNY